jgi:predicted RNase H-like nuclease (RuvC/YqgF family)
VIQEGEATEAFTTHQQDFTPIRMAYDLEHIKWDASDRKCLMVIKSSITEAITGAILNYETTKECLKKVESQFTSSLKTYASTIIKRLVMEKYSFGSGVREHILKMSNMASKLKPMDMGLKDEIIVHLVMSSLLKEFEAFEINYNSLPESWGIKKLIAMCVQEEERIKESHSDSSGGGEN